MAGTAAGPAAGAAVERAARAGTGRGIIDAGREADQVVLDRTLPAGDAAAITETRVVATVVDGRVVHGEGVA